MSEQDNTAQRALETRDLLEEAHDRARRRADLLNRARAAIQWQAHEIKRLTNDVQKQKLRSLRAIPSTPTLDRVAAALHDGHDIDRGGRMPTVVDCANAIIEADKALREARRERTQSTVRPMITLPDVPAAILRLRSDAWGQGFCAAVECIKQSLLAGGYRVLLTETGTIEEPPPETPMP